MNKIIAILTLIVSFTALPLAWGKKRHHNDDNAQGNALGLALEHLAALSACDVDAMVALRSPDFTLYLPIKFLRNVGLADAQEGWNQYCAALAGTTWEAQYSNDFEDGVVIGSQITGPAIEPYVGHDLFFTKGNKFAAQVTTFDFVELTFLSS